MDEVRAGAFTLLESGSLFSDQTHRQVRANALVWGGELQRQSTPDNHGDERDAPTD